MRYGGFLSRINVYRNAGFDAGDRRSGGLY
jgi:hypothetical protein